MTTIGNIFTSGIANKITASINAAEAEMNAPVSTGEFGKDVTLDAGTHTLNLFDAPVKLAAATTLAVKICAPGAAFTVFDDAGPLSAPATPPDGNPSGAAVAASFARLDVTGKFGAAASSSGRLGVLQLSGEASAGAQLSYTHLRPAAGVDGRLVALARLALTTQLPQLANIASLIEGESLDFSAKINADLNLMAKYGAGLDFNEVLNLVSDLSLAAKAHVQFSLSAAFGLSLYDQMRLTVGRTGQRNPGWVRVRVERSHRDRITFGAAFSLAIDYDAATGTRLLLDKIFALIPMPQLTSTMKEVLALTAAGNWAQLTTMISAKSADLVTKLVNDTGWTTWVEGSPEVKQLTDAAYWIVTEYASLDGKIRSTYEELLSRLDAAGFDHFMTLIKQIAAFNLATFDVKTLVSSQAAEAIHLVELFSGKDIEELLINGSLRTGIEKAVSTAKAIQTMVEGAPGKAIEWVNGLAARTGVAPVMTWLGTNATSPAALVAAGNTWIGSVVERLTGKSLAEINPADLVALKAFATKVQTLLAAPGDFQAKLKAHAEKLKGTFGISLSIELSRVSEWSSVVDIEVDPQDQDAVGAISRFLPAGDVQQLLSALTSIDAGNDGSLPYDLRDVLLTSRHLRTSSTALFITFLGLDKTSQSTIRDVCVRVSGGVNAPISRSGVYVGGSSVQMSAKGAVSEGGAWLRWEGSASDLDVRGAYTSVTPSLRLSYTREDDRTGQPELDGITAILTRFGFLGGAQVLVMPAPGMQTRFAVELQLGADALTALLTDVSNQADWENDLLEAGGRWFGDPAADLDQARGLKMAGVLANASYRTLWTNPTNADFMSAARDGNFGVILADLAANNFLPEFAPLQAFTQARSFRYDGYRKFRMPADNTPAALEQTILLGSKMLATGGTEWVLPLLNFWFILDRIGRLGPPAMAAAKGVATFRSRVDANSAWSGVQWLTR